MKIKVYAELAWFHNIIYVFFIINILLCERKLIFGICAVKCIYLNIDINN